MERKLKIITENCPQNHKCPAVNVCPVGALTQTNFEAPKIDYDKCIKCGKCEKVCPEGAIISGAVRMPRLPDRLTKAGRFKRY